MVTKNQMTKLSNDKTPQNCGVFLCTKKDSIKFVLVSSSEAQDMQVSIMEIDVTYLHCKPPTTCELHTPSYDKSTSTLAPS